MKHLKKILILVFSLALIMPFGVNAYDKDTKYNTLNYLETLADEEIEHEFENYEEKDDQVVIYMFRGHGCGYCKAFLGFLNSITNDYGKYFKLVSYEVWNDQQNSELLSEVAEFMGTEAGGVPYIIIGDKVFPGYTQSYDEEIKTKIEDMYNIKPEDRYDVFKKMQEKKPNHDLVVGIVSCVVIAGLVAVAVITRRKNS